MASCGPLAIGPYLKDAMLPHAPGRELESVISCPSLVNPDRRQEYNWRYVLVFLRIWVRKWFILSLSTEHRRPRFPVARAAPLEGSSRLWQCSSSSWRPRVSRLLPPLLAARYGRVSSWSRTPP